MKLHGRLIDLVWIAIIIIGFIVVLTPIFVIFLSSFNASEAFRFPPRGYSLRWYVAAFSRPEYAAALRVSMIVGTISTALAVIIGALSARALIKSEFRGKAATEGLLLAPLALPHIVWAVGLTQIYARIGIGGSLIGLVLAHTTLCLPFAVRIMMTTFSQLDETLEGAALSLGASQSQVLRTITLPLIWPGLLTSAVFTFLTSFNEVTVSVLIAGSRYLTYPVRVYSEMRSQGIDPTTVALSAMFVVVAVALVLIGERMFRWSSRL
ncbi:ABC transporter permease [Martelella sp. HB161492]|uniref:ABC transporter permease n=1 Tax=Martelella sp. HB161492 TaxID=2720726 RepID=UPI0015905FDF|nr:ABC transporter permease [Martelella sp. HB161492]